MVNGIFLFVIDKAIPWLLPLLVIHLLTPLVHLFLSLIIFLEASVTSLQGSLYIDTWVTGAGDDVLDIATYPFNTGHIVLIQAGLTSEHIGRM
jgi:hypothetical protein